MINCVPGLLFLSEFMAHSFFLSRVTSEGLEYITTSTDLASRGKYILSFEDYSFTKLKSITDIFVI